MFGINRDILKIKSSNIVKKYKLTTKSEMQINSLLTKATVETKWILLIKNIIDGGYVMDLTTHSHELLETNNEAFEQLAMITEQFNQLYSEITIVVDRTGNLRKVINKDQMKEKWGRIKNKTIKYFNEDTDLEKYFSLNDETFEQPEFVEKMVAEMEFFLVYFQAGYGYNGQKTLERDNAYRTNKIKWNISFNQKKDNYDQPTTEINVEGTTKSPNRKWTNKAYGQFPFLDVAELKPTFRLEGKYVIDKGTGLIENARLMLEEQAHPFLLYNKIEYSLEEIKQP